jgi:flagellar protein FliS
VVKVTEALADTPVCGLCDASALRSAAIKVITSMNNKSALFLYRQVNSQTAIIDADPHRLIQLLLDGALDRISQAKGSLLAGDTAAMGEALGKAIGILSGLQGSLDLERGGDIAAKLNGLYDYMSIRLLDVHREKHPASLDEVVGLLGSLKGGWDGIRPQVVPAAAP